MDIKALLLIVFMEASTQSEATQRLVASAAIARAQHEKTSIYKSMKKPKTYSWMWDGRNTKVPWDILRKRYSRLVAEELAKPSMKGRIYFNECSLGKRFKTDFKMIRSGQLCFY